MSQVALYHAADIHGSERCWRKFLNAARFYQADVLIMGDDVTGKVLVPLVWHNGGWVGRVLGEVRQAETETELEDLKQILRVNGLYPYVCERDEFERMEEDPTYMRQMREGLARWIALADEHLQGPGWSAT